MNGLLYLKKLKNLKKPLQEYDEHIGLRDLTLAQHELHRIHTNAYVDRFREGLEKYKEEHNLEWEVPALKITAFAAEGLIQQALPMRLHVTWREAWASL